MKKSRKYFMVLLCFLLVAGLLAGCGDDGETGGGTVSGGDNQAEAGNGSDTGNGIPSFSDFTAYDLEGNELDQSLWADHQLTMVNVWATSCSPCIGEMPELGELNAQYKEEGTDVQIVGIVLDVLNQDLSVSEDQLAAAREIVDKTKADYVHLVPSEDLLYAGIGSIDSVPTTFFLDSEGNIVEDSIFVGAKEKSKWDKIVSDVLKKVESK